MLLSKNMKDACERVMGAHACKRCILAIMSATGSTAGCSLPPSSSELIFSSKWLGSSEPCSCFALTGVSARTKVQEELPDLTGELTLQSSSVDKD